MPRETGDGPDQPTRSDVDKCTSDESFDPTYLFKNHCLALAYRLKGIDNSQDLFSQFQANNYSKQLTKGKQLDECGVYTFKGLPCNQN